MSTLTPEAKEYCKEALKEQGRDSLVQMLENIGIACYDDEDDDTLAESAVDSVQAGDIEFDFGIQYALTTPHYVRMLWYDVEDVWQ